MISDSSNLKKGLLENLNDTPGHDPPENSTKPTKAPGGRFKNLIKTTVMNKEYKQSHEDAFTKLKMEQPQEALAVPIHREIHFDYTRWAHTKLFFVNIIETTLLTLCLALSVYKDDAQSLVFQFLILGLLYLAMKDMGKYIPIQRKISLAVLIVLIASGATKWLLMNLTEDDLQATYDKYGELMLTFGFKFKFDQEQSPESISFNRWRSIEFEFLASLLLGILFLYYNDQYTRIAYSQPFGYVHHSQWLSQYMTLFYILFALFGIDTFFAQNGIQLIVLVFIIMLMYMWAYDYTHKNKVIKVVITWLRRFYALQLICLAVTEISFIYKAIQSVSWLYQTFYVAGLLLKYEPYYASATHIILVSIIVCLGQLYESCYHNYLHYTEERKALRKPGGIKSLSKSLLSKKGTFAQSQFQLQQQIIAQTQSQAQSSLAAVGGLQNKFAAGFLSAHANKNNETQAQSTTKGNDYDYMKLIEQYAPYVYIWVLRICCIILAYWYHGYEGLFLLSWVLLSFIQHLVPFVYWTVAFVTPLLTILLLFVYFINIPGVFLMNDGSINGYENLFLYARKLSIPPLEIGFMIFTLIFFLLLIPSRYILKLQRDEFRTTLFEKLSNKNNNFLYQLSFYVLKRLHVFVLLIIFMYAMKELTVYYIGLMFFFIMFASSLVTYRQYGRWLVGYAAFFIWLVYIWSIISVFFDKSGIAYKTVQMLLFTSEKPDEAGLNEYFKYNIPIQNWTILTVFVVLTNINYCFRQDVKIVRKSFENQNEQQEFKSTGDYYEAKTDFVLRKKFPTSAKLYNMLSFIISEMMIILILIVQAVIIAIQPATLFLWGFLIFSLILQTTIVSALTLNARVFRKCARWSRILKYYTLAVILLQVSYHFVTNPNFLAQYGLDNVLYDNIGPFKYYLKLIGFEFRKKASPIGTFISQIAFYIMACILEDYFEERLKAILSSEADEQAHDHDHDHHKHVQKSVVGLNGQNIIVTESEDEDESEHIKYNYEKVRFRISYMIYQKMHWWKYIDIFTLYFYLLTATVIVYFCVFWQISLFMAFFLVCAVVMCLRACQALYSNGNTMTSERVDIKYNTATEVNRGFMLQGKEKLNLEQAHQLNREYNQKANLTLMNVRKRQWAYQYWILIVSMIIIYPTSTLPLFQKKLPQYDQQFDKAIFWLFWSGLNIVEEPGKETILPHIPLYTILILLILEKLAQRWQKNRFGCTIENITIYKTLDEQMKLINAGKAAQYINLEDQQEKQGHVDLHKRPRDLNPVSFVTIGKAAQECKRIEELYVYQTQDMKDESLKQTLILELKRKYTIQWRAGQKIILEQLSLLQLLLSCAFKSNIVSIIYLVVLFIFLRIKDKTKGMLIMAYTFGIMVAIEYCATLTNLSTLNTPQNFPAQYRPYPSLDEPYGVYVFPWFLKVDFLRNNLKWTIFFGLDIEKGAITDIVFDYINLIILTIYFFNFGNPINSKNLKVSFSKTASLEKVLNEYSHSMMKKKALIKQSRQVIAEENEQQEFNDTYSEQAADDSKEYFLGATYYLYQLKNDIFLYYFINNTRYAIFLGSQILTLTLIFLIALLQTSFMSIGYMIGCVPLILSITDYFNIEKLHQENRKWMHPIYISGGLMIFSFIDIALQIFFQIPFQEGSQLQDWFGFSKIYQIQELNSYKSMLNKSGRIANVNEENLNLLILKCFNLFFIFLQSRIFESEGFRKFTRGDRRLLTNLAQKEKKFAITYRFNNWKLQKIAALQQNKNVLYEGVAELKVKLKMWASLVSGTGLGLNPQISTSQKSVGQSKPNLAINTTNESSLLQQEEPTPIEQPDTLSTLKSSGKKALFNPKAMFQLNVAKALKKDLTSFVDSSELANMEKKIILKQKKTELPRLGRWYLKIKKEYVNSILFITDLEEATSLRKAMESGQRNILCDLELIMQKDINYHYSIFQSIQKKTKDSPTKGKKKSEKIDIKISEMEGLQDFLSWGNILLSLGSVILQAAFCNCAFIAYTFMIISQLVNAGLISIIYPFAVFGYALMEEARPPKGFWHFMLRYTIFILFMKFLCQLDVWETLLGQGPLFTEIVHYDEWLQFGLWKVKGISALFSYIAPEIIVLFAIMCQIYYEILIGLHDKREVEVENILEAKQRYLKSIAGSYQIGSRTIVQKKPKGLELEEEDDFQEKALTPDQRIIQYQIDIVQARLIFENLDKKGRVYEDFIQSNPQTQKGRDEYINDAEPYILQRQNSFIDSRAGLKQAAGILKQKRKQANPSGFVKQYFGRRNYFKNLFPLIKEQKPGVDLYAWTTLIQFIICIYILNYYTQMDAVGTQNIENTSQFSFHMVIVLFFQVATMVMERYINRTNIRVKVKKIGSNKREQGHSDETFYEKMKLQDTPRSMSIHVKTLKTGDNVLDRNIVQTAVHHTTQVEPELTLSQTRISVQQVSKYLLQWGLLIIYHGAVFWYFPLYSNYAIYGTPTCNKSSRAFATYQCFSFHQNMAILIFYLICCLYFTFSALQIQYGLPDFRKGSILMDKYDATHQFSYLIFYNIPFAMELKTILDWCFTKTSLDVNQWLELVHINTELFFAKCSNQSYFQRKLGTVISNMEKYICGCLCLGIIFFCLLGPFLMFSNLSYIASENLVTSSSMDFMIKISNDLNGESYNFPMFDSSSAIYLQPIEEEEFIRKAYDIQPETKFFEYNQAQVIKMKNSSETEWQLSGDQKTIYNELIGKAAQGDESIHIQLILSIYFDRPGPLNAMTSTSDIIRNLNSSNANDSLLIKQFDQATELKCNESSSAIAVITIPNYLGTHIRLTEQVGFSGLINEETMELEDVELTYSCGNFWMININEERIVFTTFSDYISSGFLSASSIMAFYLGVSYIVGTTLRKIVVYNTDRIFICDMPHSEALLNLCNCIYLQRLEQNLKKEEELYFVLLECLRSPEMLKAIAGSSLRHPI